MSCNNQDYTVSFDEQVKGWTSFHSYFPDFMLGLNNDLFTFKDGNLYMHNSENSNRNTFYGVSFPSKVSLMVNQEPSAIKELQAVSLEGSKPWDIKLKAYVNDRKNFIKSSINGSEFVEKEGQWFAYARRNEDPTHNNSKSTYGLGETSNIGTTSIQINGQNSSLTTGDILYKGSDLSEIGTVNSHIYDSEIGLTTVNLNSVVALPSIGDFIIGKKDPRIEGANLRGYTMRMDLEVTSDDMVELYATNAEVMKSFT